MTLLVIGAQGQLGCEICRQGGTHGLEVVGLDLPDVARTLLRPHSYKFKINHSQFIIISLP